MNINSINSNNPKRSTFLEGLYCLWGLAPLLLFFALFIGSGIYYSLQDNAQAFYQLSASVAILPAIIFAILLFKGSLKKSLAIFLQGARNENIIIMCLVYLLAGAFASVLQQIGGVNSFVNLVLSFVPKAATLPALFLITSIVSTAMGTSMGTIAAIGPIGVGISNLLGIPLPLTMGTIIGGAMFGDNLSMISDTSIAATQIHGCTVRDKFKNNARIAIPCMLLTLTLLCLMTFSSSLSSIINPASLNTAAINSISNYQMIHGLPYLVVLAFAIAGTNVFVVLILGIITAGLIGIFTVPDYHLMTLSKNIFDGYKSMTEILILSLLMGGLGELIKSQGGFKRLTDFLEYSLLPGKGNQKMAEASICTIVSISDICTANNTAAIILSGEATREIAQQNNISPVRTATLVDLFSCVFQGILPYSAQVLMAGSLAQISPLSIIPNIHYCFILGFAGIATIIFKRRIRHCERSEAIQKQLI